MNDPAFDPAIEPGRSRAVRFPVLLVVVALLVAGALAPRWREVDVGAPSDVTTAVPIDRWLPSVAGPGAGGGVWYCAAGTALGTAGGLAEQTVILTNVSSVPSRTKLTAVSSEGPTEVRMVEVGPFTRVDVLVSDLLRAPFAAALVESTGGQVVATHRLDGRLGSSYGPCASAPSTRWLFPGGTTRFLAQEVLAVFNPFPDAAVLDITFTAEDGKRSPVEFQGKVVPPGSLSVLQIADVVTVRQQLSTDVHVRAGRVVVERLVAFDPNDGERTRTEGRATATVPGATTLSAPPATAGAGGTATPDDVDAAAFSGPGISVDLGAPVAAPTWVFPGSPERDADERQDYVLYNPGERETEAVIAVTLEAEPGSGTSATVVEPYTTTVRPGQFAVVAFDNEQRIPAGRRHWEFVFTSDGAPIVAERVVRRRSDASVPGLDLSPGSPAAATTWVLPAARFDDSISAEVALVNPSHTESAVVEVSMLGDGAEGLISGLDRLEIAPGTQRVVELAGLPTGAHGAIVRADRPVVVAQTHTFGRPLSVSSSVAVPIASTVAPLAAPDLTADVLTGDGDFELPAGSTVFTVVPGTDPTIVPTTAVPPVPATSSPETPPSSIEAAPG